MFPYFFVLFIPTTLSLTSLLTDKLNFFSSPSFSLLPWLPLALLKRQASSPTSSDGGLRSRAQGEIKPRRLPLPRSEPCFLSSYDQAGAQRESSHFD